MDRPALLRLLCAQLRRIPCLRGAVRWARRIVAPSPPPEVLSRLQTFLHHITLNH